MRRIGRAWGKLVYTWSQVAIPFSMLQLGINASTLYIVATQSWAWFKISIWLWYAAFFGMAVLFVLFVVFVGMKGYFSILNDSTDIGATRQGLIQMQADLKQIKEHLGIADDVH